MPIASSRYAEPDRDAAALVRAWGHPRQPSYGPLVMVYDEPREAPRLRTKRYERRIYDGMPVVPLAELPTTIPNRDAVLPKEQMGWELVSDQVYRSGSKSGHYVVRVRHAACGATRHISRTQWLRGANLGARCQACFRPSSLAMIPMTRREP